MLYLYGGKHGKNNVIATNGKEVQTIIVHFKPWLNSEP